MGVIDKCIVNLHCILCIRLLVLGVQKYFYYLLNLLSFGNFCDNNDLSGILHLKTTSCAH